MKFRKKPVVIEAVRWFGHVDENADVRRYVAEKDVWSCAHCGKSMHEHGWIDTMEGGHIVCPGDWIITGVQGEKYPCKPDVFEHTYEAVSAEPAERKDMSDERLRRERDEAQVYAHLRMGLEAENKRLAARIAELEREQASQRKLRRQLDESRKANAPIQEENRDLREDRDMVDEQRLAAEARVAELEAKLEIREKKS